MAVNRNPMKNQRGAAMVEFAITFLVYLLLIFAIIEFALVIFNSTRLAEGTRTGARYAIVNNPACDIFGNGNGDACDDGVLDCTLNPSVSVTMDSCPIPAAADDSKCRMVEEMDKLMLRYDKDPSRYQQSTILAGAGKVTVGYTCSDVGDPDIRAVPIVTVSVEDIQHNMLLFGTQITLPSFSTSRTGEDMFNR